MQLSLVLNYIWLRPINLAHTYAHVYYHIFSINQFSHSHVCTTTNQGWELQHRAQAKQSIHFAKICKSTIYIQFALGATATGQCTTGEQMSVCTTPSGPDFAAERAVSTWEERRYINSLTQRPSLHGQEIHCTHIASNLEFLSQIFFHIALEKNNNFPSKLWEKPGAESLGFEYILHSKLSIVQAIFPCYIKLW